MSRKSDAQMKKWNNVPWPALVSPCEFIVNRSNPLDDAAADVFATDDAKLRTWSPPGPDAPPNDEICSCSSTSMLRNPNNAIIGALVLSASPSTSIAAADDEEDDEDEDGAEGGAKRMCERSSGLVALTTMAHISEWHNVGSVRYTA